jgi:hypothetical protein
MNATNSELSATSNRRSASEPGLFDPDSRETPVIENNGGPVTRVPSSARQAYQFQQEARRSYSSSSSISQVSQHDVEDIAVVMTMSSELSHSGTVHYSRLPGVDHSTTPTQNNGNDTLPSESHEAPGSQARISRSTVQEILIPASVEVDLSGKDFTSRKWHWKTMGTVFGFLLAGKF